MFGSLLLTVLALIGCGASPESSRLDEPREPTDSSTTDDGSKDASSPPSNTPGSPDPSDPVPTKPCDPAQTAAVQANIDASHPKIVDAVAVVRDECGVRYFTSGPSQYPRTTLQRFASNTKTYTASLILLLVEDGLLDLDAPISKWIDGVPGGNKVLLRHILYQDSGISDYARDYVFMASVLASGGAKYTPQQLLNVAFPRGLAYEPGNGWNYSNTNYVLLGMIAEKVTGRKAHDLIRERILDKIGAKHTYFAGQEDVPGELAVGLGADDRDWSYATDMSVVWTAGDMVGTPEDLALWVEKRATGQFHSAATQKLLMNTIHATNDFEYGAGLVQWHPELTAGAGIGLGHDGEWFGYHSYGIYFPEKKTTVVVFVDSDAGPKGVFPLSPTYSGHVLGGVITGLFGAPPASAQE